MSQSFDPQFESESSLDDAAVLARGVLAGTGVASRGSVVNRTHRVVRHRAKMMQARKSHVRSLMVPLIVCSALLLLSVVAMWSGMYQYQAAEAVDAVQADVAALASSDAMDHLMVVLLWFVPVSLSLLAIVWFRHLHTTADRRIVR